MPESGRNTDPRPVRPAAHHRPEATVQPPAPENKERPLKNRLRRPPAYKNWKKIIGGLVLAALVAWLAYGYITTRNQLEQARSPAAAGQSQTQQLVNKVGQLVDLPQGEIPAIATVNDASKLKNQAFFANAKDGDKVLIYSKTGKAVLYRPSTNRVIEYSKVNLGGSSNQ